MGSKNVCFWPLSALNEFFKNSVKMGQKAFLIKWQSVTLDKVHLMSFVFWREEFCHYCSAQYSSLNDPYAVLYPLLLGVRTLFARFWGTLFHTGNLLVINQLTYISFTQFFMFPPFYAQVKNNSKKNCWLKIATYTLHLGFILCIRGPFSVLWKDLAHLSFYDESFFSVLSSFDLGAKLYIPSTLNIDLTVAHTIDCVCSKMLNHGYFFHFSSLYPAPYIELC